MNSIFKEHFRINGGSFKTHEDEVEAYVKKTIKDFHTFTMFFKHTSFTDEQKDILAEQAYNTYKKERNEK